MPQMNDVVFNDGTGDSHTFVPENIENGVASWVIPGNSPIGDWRLTASRSKTTTGRRKATFKVAIPVVGTVNGVDTVLRTSYADLTFTFDATSAKAERTHLRAIVAALMSNANAVAAVDDLSAFY